MVSDDEGVAAKADAVAGGGLAGQRQEWLVNSNGTRQINDTGGGKKDGSKTACFGGGAEAARSGFCRGEWRRRGPPPEFPPRRLWCRGKQGRGPELSLDGLVELRQQALQLLGTLFGDTQLIGKVHRRQHGDAAGVEITAASN